MSRFLRAMSIGLLGIALVACGSPRLLIATGTTIGLKASPGDGQARPPQVTFAYRRAEVAVIPTPEDQEKRGGQRDSSGKLVQDAYSTLAAISFFTKWWGETRLDSVVATGHAARELQEPKR